MIEWADIKSIRAVPGGVELLVRAPAVGDYATRVPYVVSYDWQAAQQIANELGALCAQEELRKRGYR